MSTSLDWVSVPRVWSSYRFHSLPHKLSICIIYMLVCVCVCARARARACACVCVRVNVWGLDITGGQGLEIQVQLVNGPMEYLTPAELTVAVHIDAGAYASYRYNGTTIQANCSAPLQADASSNRLGGACICTYVCMLLTHVCKYMYVCLHVCV